MSVGLRVHEYQGLRIRIHLARIHYIYIYKELYVYFADRILGSEFIIRPEAWDYINSQKKGKLCAYPHIFPNSFLIVLLGSSAANILEASG